MHFHHGTIPKEYRTYIGRKITLLLFTLLLLIGCFGIGIITGSADLSPVSVLRSVGGLAVTKQVDAIIWNIRMPQVLASMLAGGGLAVSGAVMQAILRNPLGSPFTLGISHAAAFGAAFSVMILGSGVLTSGTGGQVAITNPYLTALSAFAFSICAAGLIMMVAHLRGTSPEVMILSGVALGAMFTAATMFLQFFADDMQLAAMVFWTFGDTARAGWQDLAFMAVVVLLCFLYFLANSWNYNAIDAGDETAKGLGVRVQRLRLISMLLASLLTAVLIAFLGVIGFVGLVVPHMMRRLIGADHRFLLPMSLVGGAVLLLLSDTVARMVLAPHVLPVSVLTAFLGAPLFFWLILLRRKA